MSHLCPIIDENRLKKVPDGGYPCRGEVPVLHAMNMYYYLAHSASIAIAHSVCYSNALGT